MTKNVINRSSNQRCSIKKAVLKSDSNAVVFLWILWNISEHLFWRTSANSLPLSKVILKVLEIFRFISSLHYYAITFLNNLRGRLRYVASFIFLKNEIIVHKSNNICRNMCFCKKKPLEVFYEKSVLKKIHKKHLCRSLFFNEIAWLRHATLLKKKLQHRCFPADFVKFLRTPFFRRLFLFCNI